MGVDQAPTDRTGEWYVPAFGPAAFRSWVGLLFLPYTAMVLAFTVLGSVLADPVHWDRVAGILLIYGLGLGIGAHALDALGSKGTKPWGTAFSGRQLWALAVASLTLAYAIGIYYIVVHAPLLWTVALLEGFFVFAYNLEWFHGRFHTDGWFAFSWGSLPVLAGYILQTNSVSAGALIIAAATGLFSLAEIKVSRPYKGLKKLRTFRLDQDVDRDQVDLGEIACKLESVLKALSLGVILLGVGFAVWRWIG